MTPGPDEFDLILDTAPAPGPGGPRLWLASAGLCGLFAAVLAWSVLPAATPEAAPPAVAAPVAVASVPVPAAGPVVAQAALPAVETHAWAPARRVPALERLTLGLLRPGSERPEPLRLGDALGDAVAVVNVWASYCAPCLRELPGIQALARADAWGRAVRLVPVLAEPLRADEPQQATMLAALQADPAAPRLLVDPEGALAATLVGEAMIRGPGLPITLVFTCGALAWARVGEVDPDTLAGVVADARTQAAGCRPEPALDPDPALLAPGCGDAVCDAAAESCASCETDCRCVGGTVCVVDAARTGHCVRPAEELKP